MLIAFQDVEDALVAYTNEQVRYQAPAEAVSANQQATNLSNELYTRGLAAVGTRLSPVRSVGARRLFGYHSPVTVQAAGRVSRGGRHWCGEERS